MEHGRERPALLRVPQREDPSALPFIHIGAGPCATEVIVVRHVRNIAHLMMNVFEVNR